MVPHYNEVQLYTITFRHIDILTYYCLHQLALFG